MKTPTSLPLFSLALITVLLSGCTTPDVATEQETTPHTDVVQDTTTDEVLKTDTHTTILYNNNGSIDTSNWKTYTNEEYGFRVRYPEGWSVDEYMLTALPGDGVNCLLLPTPKECDTFSVQFGFVDDSITLRLLKNKKEHIAHVMDDATDVRYGSISYSMTASYSAMTRSCNSSAVLPINVSTHIMLNSSYSSIEDMRKKIGYNFDPVGNDVMDEFCMTSADVSLLNVIIDSFTML